MWFYIAFYGSLKLQDDRYKIIFKIKVSFGRVGCRIGSHVPVRFLW